MADLEYRRAVRDKALGVGDSVAKHEERMGRVRSRTCSGCSA